MNPSNRWNGMGSYSLGESLLLWKMKGWMCRTRRMNVCRLGHQSDYYPFLLLIGFVVMIVKTTEAIASLNFH